MTAPLTSPADVDQPIKVALDPAAAAELVDLLADEPGVADEELLDDALEALEAPHAHLPAETQAAVASGEAVAIQVEPHELDIAKTLIEEDRVDRPDVARRLRDRLRARVERARKRAWRR